mmetsp:Transcript_109/g.169  ORF Transcript_109/g.169 Transcript_109/m.169 type:complete len:634 (+) Transcript_109:126-2027(+)
MEERRYSGVAWSKKENKWKARYVRNDGKRVWLKGKYDTGEEAARAYDAAVLEDGLAAQPLNFATRDANGGVVLAPTARGAQSLASLQEHTAQVKSSLQESSAGWKRKQPDTNEWTTVGRPKRVRPAEPPLFPWVEKQLANKLDSLNKTLRYPLPSSMLNKRLASLVDTCYSSKLLEKQFKELLEAATESKDSWVFTANPSEDEPRLLGVDCEMVMCRRTGSKDTSAVKTLARVSLVQYKVKVREGKEDKVKFKTLLDEYIRLPRGFEVVDYMTSLSGITPELMEKASMSGEEARATVADIVHATDILTGHSISADFGALQLWHGNFIDTSCLCTIDGLPELTIGLKDLVAVLFEGTEKAAEFRRDGGSHDSVDDAEWSVRALVQLLALKNNDGEPVTIPYVLPDVPEQFQKRLTFQGIPEGFSKSVVEMILETCVEQAKEEAEAMELSDVDKLNFTFSVEEIKYSLRKNGKVTGTCMVIFPDAKASKLVFEAMKTAERGCGGYAKSGPCYPAGYPDRQNLMRKLIAMPGQQLLKKSIPLKTCEVISFFPTKLPFQKVMQIRMGVLGRVMGKRGSTVTMIQQISGARAQVIKQAERGDPTAFAEFLIEADSLPKANQAAEMVHKAMRNTLVINV